VLKINNKLIEIRNEILETRKRKIMKNKRKGFSFIELIVVVTIIAVLSVAGVISYSAANKKSRDSRRISDLEKMRMALEMVRQVGVTYPTTIGVLAPDYMQTVPTDPKSDGSAYLYQQLNSGYGYQLTASMEDLGSTNGAYGGTYNYRVFNP
jgi:prepilin-type N-terminal cleavage/methylation domain-containing protein